MESCQYLVQLSQAHLEMHELLLFIALPLRVLWVVTLLSRL